MKYYLGIDQSYSNTGLCLINEKSEIVAVTTIPVSNDFFKFYNNNDHMDFEATMAFKSGLVDKEMKLTKKKSECSKEELDMLKVSQSKRIHYICLRIEKFLNDHYATPDQVRCGLENISLGSKGAIVDLARLMGAIEHHLRLIGVRHVLFPPTQVKSFAGKGNYSKEEMVAAVPEADMRFIKSCLEVDKKGEHLGLFDATDAYWISKLAKVHYEKQHQ